MSPHPSHWVLDLAALGGEVPAEVARHLGTCPACAASVRARRTRDPLPPWVAQVRLAPRPDATGTRLGRALEALRRRRWWLLPLPAAAALAVALVVLRPATSSEVPEAGLRQKGAPRVTVYVKRGDRVAIWDGRSPVRAGDRLRLGIAGAGFANLSVASLQPGAGPQVLFAGSLAPQGETLLPLSFRVDGAGTAERLSVVLSPHPVSPTAHALEPSRHPSQGEWTTRLLIPKEPAP